MTTIVKKNKKLESYKNINLYDILPIKTVNKTNNKRKDEIISEFIEIKKSLTDLESNLSIFFDKKYIYEVFTSLQSKNNTIEKLHELRKSFLHEYNYLPTDMMGMIMIKETSGYWEQRGLNIISTYEDSLSKLSKSSIISGEDVKSITDSFGFVTIPVECLNEASYENESYQMKREITNFSKNLENDYDIYVITPIEYYSLENHVYKNKNEKGIYAGQHSMIFTSVIINIPMFRSVLNTIADIDGDVNVLKKEVLVVKDSLSQVQTTLKNLQRQVDKQQKQLIQQRISIEKQAESMVKFESMVLRVIDPVMIAVKKGIDINSDEFDETACFIGPCWGPDFNEVVSMALDLKIIKNQRSKLTKSSNELWN